MSSPHKSHSPKQILREQAKASDLLEEDRRCLEVAFHFGVQEHTFALNDYVTDFGLKQKYDRLGLSHRSFNNQVQQWTRRKEKPSVIWDVITDPVFQYIIKKGGTIPDTIQPSRYLQVPNNRTEYREPKTGMSSDSESSDSEQYQAPPKAVTSKSKPIKAPAPRLPSVKSPTASTMPDPPGPSSSHLSFDLSQSNLTFEQVNKLREFRAIDPRNPQNNPPYVQTWVTENQTVKLDGEDHTVTKFTILISVGSDPSVLAIYQGSQGQKAQLEHNGYGVTVPMPSMPPDYIRECVLIKETARLTVYDDTDGELGDDAWVSSVSLFCFLVLT